MIENLQRENLNPVEEAMGYKTLIDEFEFTQDEISKSVGKSRPVIANALRLLKLPKEILDMLSEGKITTGHARALISIEDSSEQLRIAEQIVANDLTVRDIERIAKSLNAGNKEKKKAETHRRSAFYDEVELALNEHLSRKVKVVGGKDSGGVLEIEFYSEDDLGELAKLFG